jgi:hypothetical protein
MIAARKCRRKQDELTIPIDPFARYNLTLVEQFDTRRTGRTPRHHRLAAWGDTYDIEFRRLRAASRRAGT